MTAPMIRLANPERIAMEALADVLTPPPPIDYEKWAVDNVVFTTTDSPSFPGPYDPDLFPFFTEILKALSPDDPCGTVTFRKSAQLGGTVLANIFTLGSLTMDAGDMLYVHPTEENGRRWSRMKLKRLMDSTALVRRLFPASAKDASDSTMRKERRDGLATLQIAGANSAAGLSQMTVARQVQDDLAKWSNNDAGDPESQADSRSWAVEFAKVFKISTPMVMPGCRITKNFEEGSQEYYEVPCPHCDTYQVLEWDNLKANIEAGHLEDAHFDCVSCGCAIEDHHRRAMVRRGRWVARRPEMKARHRSFFLWSAYSALQSLARIAYKWLKAKGEAGAEQTFLNDVVGEAFVTTGEAPAWEDLRQRGDELGHARGTIPAGGLVVTCGIDVQGNRIEWQAIAWTRNRGACVIDYGVIPHEIGDPEATEALDKLTTRTFRNCAGRQIGFDRIAIDGNYRTDDVLAWAKRKPSSLVMVVRGVGKDGKPTLAFVKKEYTKAGKVRKHGGRFFNVGTSGIKLRLYHNLGKDDPVSPGYIAFPKFLGDDYYRMLTAERRKPIKRRSGFIEYEWVPVEERNEALDTFVYSFAAFYRYAGDQQSDEFWDRMEAERETPMAGAQLDFEDLPLGPSPAPASPAAIEVPAVNPAEAKPGKSKMTDALAALAALNG